MKDYEVFNSYDVVSLFPNTLIETALNIIWVRLNSDDTLMKTTMLNVEDIMELLAIVLQLISSLEKTYFRHKFGVAMESPVSHVVSNWFMEHLDQAAIATEP